MNIAMHRVVVTIDVVLQFLKHRNLPPAFTVGSEGMFGILIMCCIMLPIVGYVPGTGAHLAYRSSYQCSLRIAVLFSMACGRSDGNGVRENAYDALVMIGNSPSLLGLVLGYIASIAVCT